MLHAVEIPPVGGDTVFANMYLAYDSLSEGMKNLIEGLHGVHPGGERFVDDNHTARSDEVKRLNPPVAQPLARVHPETGRKSLFITERVRQIVGLSMDESRPLMD